MQLVADSFQGTRLPRGEDSYVEYGSRGPTIYHVQLDYDEGIPYLRKETQGWSGTTFRLLFLLMEKMEEFNTPAITLHIGGMAEELSVTENTVYHSLSALMQHSIVRKICKGHYLLNPHFVWRGNSLLQYKARSKWSGTELPDKVKIALERKATRNRILKNIDENYDMLVAQEEEK